jgi:hypothetical protein
MPECRIGGDSSASSICDSDADRRADRGAGRHALAAVFRTRRNVVVAADRGFTVAAGGADVKITDAIRRETGTHQLGRRLLDLRQLVETARDDVCHVCLREVSDSDMSRTASLSSRRAAASGLENPA